jgi:mannose-6-phosphate isomerase
MTFQPYAMILQPQLHARVWGGNRLSTHLGKDLPPGQPIGESWEVFWKNPIRGGHYAGRTLGDLIAEFPADMVGNASADAEYPLLVKYLDTREWLSVQVHPDDAKALELEGQPRGKTECWYVMEAEPGAQLAFGLAEPLDAASLRGAIESGRARDVMQYVDVQVGDFIYVPAGTMHALGPGLLIYELQQTSDTTYRVYDWDRLGLDGKPRELHLDKALACTHFDVKPQAVKPLPPGTGMLVESQYFSLERIVWDDETVRDTAGKSAHLLSVIEGHAEVRIDGHSPVLLPQGVSAFIPACVGRYTLVADGSATVLRAWN